MIRRPPRSTLTDTLFPDTTLFRSLVTGAVWQGVTLTLFGVLVIGLVDNILRPLLVGKDTKIPDYVILISTLGGLAVFGLNGFVIGPLFAALFLACWDLFPSAIRMNQERSEERREGNECVSTCTSRWSPYH